MWLHEPSGCTQTLLDLLCYEIRAHGLSPEMQHLLELHVAECPSCSRGMHNFKEVLERGELYPEVH
jgi:hypothetical protein